MLWCEHLVQKLTGPQLINDSKTPSGRAHVGALRGVLIHDAIFRTLQAKEAEVRYTFGVDDYDPLDELPSGQGQHFEKYLGQPLCNVPPPPGSSAPDMARHYIEDFFTVFEELGVRPETYYMREIYRSGKFNEAIDRILRQAATVRRIYKEVSNSDRPESWHPFQAVCENCGRIGTTEVSAYDGAEVTYHCRPDLVKWARGCGHKGKVSPFDGKGKLPWKLEWVAKWQTFGVTIEGGGMDHNTKGGSRDVAAHCLPAIFGKQPPFNVPYQFFLVEGAKMSSSKGVGVSAREMADFLPPEILRFLMIRTKPNNHVNFSPSEAHIIKLFNEYDRYHWRAFHDPKVSEEEKQVYFLSEVTQEGPCFDADFQIVVTLCQMPHLDLFKEMEKRKGAPLTEVELKHLRRRIQAAKYWLERYAIEEEKTRLQETLPARAEELSDTQKAFLHILADRLPAIEWKDEIIQAEIFAAARLTPIEQPKAFQAIYRVLLDRESGPKAGNLLSFLERDFVIKRCREIAVNKAAFWTESAMTTSELEAWLEKEKMKIAKAGRQIRRTNALGELAATGVSEANEIQVLELFFTMNDGKTHCKRLLASESSGQFTSDYLEHLQQAYGVQFS